MAQARPIIDISDNPELLHIVEQAREARAPIVLRAGGEEVAEITTLKPARRSQKRAKTQADFEEFLSTFGSWEGVDGEALKAELRAARGSNRPPIEL
jgi:hypothetical protein